MADDSDRGIIERFHATVSTVALALLGWLFLELQELTVTVARQTEQLAGLRGQVMAGMDDRYRAKDADRDFEILDGQIRRDFSIRDDRIKRLEIRLDVLEGKAQQGPP